MSRFAPLTLAAVSLALLFPPTGSAQPVAPSTEVPTSSPAAPSPSATAATQPASATPESAHDVVERIARASADAQHLPGLAVAVVDHGTVVATEAFGYANREKRVPVTAGTRFEIGSITKQFTAACILQLSEQHALSLDDRLGRYVPDYRRGRDVTIRQLLEQVSGIPEYLDGKTVVAQAGRPTTFSQLVARIATKPLAFAPGTRWQYSNTNYVLLGRVVEVASHETYERYVRAHLFATAGMVRSGFIGDGADVAQTALGYERGPRGTRRAPPLDETWARSAGAIVSTVGDLVAWDGALLTGKIVAPKDVELMRTSATLANGKATGYGFGWLIDAVEGHPRIWHNGGTFGFHAMNATYPSDGQTVVVLTNLADALPEATANHIFLGLHPDLARARETAAPGEEPAVTARVREWLRRFQMGDIDRSQLSATMSAALTPQVVTAAKAELAPLGELRTLTFRGKASLPDGSTAYTYLATLAQGTFRILMVVTPDGKLAGYRVQPE